jgi:glycerol-3-phosphate dehydrogenase
VQSFATRATIDSGSTRLELTRDHALERLARERFDLVVIGGGIVGAGTAALAAQHGLKVALVEQYDFASGTSSASSKLIHGGLRYLHGGLRYLRMGHFAHVREARAEASVLERIVAPHLVHDLRFVLPIYRDGPYGRESIRAGLALYTTLTASVRDRGRIVPPARARELVPMLNATGLRGAGLYGDAQTNDARLCLANARAAADAGAVVINRARATGLRRVNGRATVEVLDIVEGATVAVTARAVVNASGPWVDAVRRLEDPRAETSVILSKGAHLVLEPPEPWSTAVIIPIERTRVSFAVPWEGLLLLGTTAEPFTPGRDTLEVTAREERQILSEAGSVLSPDAVRAESIRYRFAGLRVLPVGNGSTAEVRREVTLSRGRHGVVSVAGGKLTTYRRIARAVLEELRTDVELHRLDARPRPLPGAVDPEAEAASRRRRHPEVAPELLRHLARMYGALTGEVLAYASTRADARDPIVDGAPRRRRSGVLRARSRMGARVRRRQPPRHDARDAGARFAGTPRTLAHSARCGTDARTERRHRRSGCPLSWT